MLVAIVVILDISATYYLLHISRKFILVKTKFLPRLFLIIERDRHSFNLLCPECGAWSFIFLLVKSVHNYFVLFYIFVPIILSLRHPCTYWYARVLTERHHPHYFTHLSRLYIFTFFFLNWISAFSVFPIFCIFCPYSLQCVLFICTSLKGSRSILNLLTGWLSVGPHYLYLTRLLLVVYSSFISLGRPDTPY